MPQTCFAPLRVAAVERRPPRAGLLFFWQGALHEPLVPKTQSTLEKAPADGRGTVAVPHDEELLHSAKALASRTSKKEKRGLRGSITAWEAEGLRIVGYRLGNGEIAQPTEFSEGVAENHAHRIYEKPEVRNRF